MRTPEWDEWFEEHAPVVSKAPLARFAVRDCSDGQQVFAFADPDTAFAYKYAPASTARPHTGYLYQRPGSTKWWIPTLRYPADLGLKTFQKSLGTSDKREAEVLALPLIAEICKEAVRR